MKAFDIHTDRRAFMKMMSAAAATPMMGNMMQAAYAAGPFNDYRALVCVFLFGGTDSHNMIIPLGAEYAGYAAGRGNLAIPQASAIPINAGLSGRSFGMHPSMPGLANIFNTDRKLAVATNVGVLLKPTDLAAYNAQNTLPPQLFSHSDMQSHWQTGRADYPAESGWGGRLADLIDGAMGSGQVSVSISAAGQSLMQKGNRVVSYAVAPWTGPKSTIVRRLRAYRDWDNWSPQRPDPQAMFESELVAARANILEAQWGQMATAARDTGNYLNGVLYNLDTAGNPIKDASGNVSEKFPITPAPPATYVDSGGLTQNNRLAAQLRAVANMIAARDTIGVKRQIFFVSLGGFDNHGDQFKGSNASVPILSGLHSDLLKQLDAALTWFYDWTKSQGIANNVTSFTMSDFGRTLTSNGLGSDHGWGGHYFAIGGGVNGGAFYGGPSAGQEFPTIALKTNVDVGQGRLLPYTSVDEYGATFARWLGATGTGELNSVFPNLGRFARTNGMPFLV
jgi:uncharacterized protein (DUF1501 family)